MVTPLSTGNVQVIEYRLQEPGSVTPAARPDELDTPRRRLVAPHPERMIRKEERLPEPLLSMGFGPSAVQFVVPPGGLDDVEDAFHEDKDFEILLDRSLPSLYLERSYPDAGSLPDEDLRQLLLGKRRLFARMDGKSETTARTALRALARPGHRAPQSPTSGGLETDPVSAAPSDSLTFVRIQTCACIFVDERRLEVAGSIRGAHGAQREVAGQVVSQFPNDAFEFLVSPIRSQI